MTDTKEMDRINSIFAVMSQLIVDAHFDVIDNILDSIDVSDTPIEVLIAYLTSTFMIRNLTRYGQFKARVVDYLKIKYPNEWYGMVGGL
jgi:hypothetical protein